jgi:hypothetical protein
LSVKGSAIPDFLRIPRPLQERFYAAAEEEAQILAQQIAELSSNVGELSSVIRVGIKRVEGNDAWKDLRIGVVDGSDLPAINERIGLRYGLYSVAYKLFRGLDPIDGGEWFYGDRVSGSIGMQRESFLKILDLLTTYYERYTANSLLGEVDLLMVDGSFFGYRTGCSMVKREELGWRDNLTGNTFRTVYDLISKINELTIRLIESGKVFGVIKRVATMAIDGYICYRYGAQKGIVLSDRSILSLLMKRGEVFDYDEIFGPDMRFDALTWYRGISREKSWRKRPPSEILEEAVRRVEVQLVADLTPHGGRRGRQKSYVGKEVVKAARSTKRVFVKTVDDIPPVCVEFSSTMSEELRNLILSYVLSTASPGTGLPIPLDLVDELVSLPRGLGREFVNEIEAELLRKGFSKESLIAIFARYNPQKDET